MFLKRWFKNTVKYSILHMWCCKSRANSGVLATLAFFWRCKNIVNIPMFRLYFGVAREGKHRKYRCFVFGGSRKHCKLRCFERFPKQKFSHLKGKKHRKIQRFCIFGILMLIFVFRHSPKHLFRCCKNIEKTIVSASFWGSESAKTSHVALFCLRWEYKTL